MPEDPASGPRPARRLVTFGGRPASITLLAMAHLLLAAYLAIAPFVRNDGSGARRRMGRDVLVFGYELPDYVSSILALVFFLIGLGLLRRPCRLARLAASVLALLAMAFCMLGEVTSLMLGRAEEAHAITVLQLWVRVGLIACGFGLLLTLLNSASVRRWCARREAPAPGGEASTGEALLDARIEHNRRGCLPVSFVLLFGLAVGLTVLYFAVWFFIRVLAGILGGGSVP